MFTFSGRTILTRPLALVASLALSLSVLVPVSQAASAQPAAAAPAAPAVEAAAAGDFKVLVFSKTAGFAHSARDEAEQAIVALGAANNFDVVIDSDAARFTEAGLAEFDAVVFNSTTGDVLDPTQQAAFEAYIQGGGGFVGLHSATDTEYDWDWYRQLVGGYFESHPDQQNATIKVEDHVHPSTAHLGDTWQRFDEWYNIRNQDRDKIHVLLSLDEKSYQGGADGAEHPIAWCQDFDGGRSWYTGLGHTEASYTEAAFLTHLLGGIETAAGVVAASCGASQTSSYELVPLDENTSNPMLLDVADDGSVFYAERDGRLRLIDPTTNVTTTVMTLPVTIANEDGLLGIILDPDFTTNGWIYAYWGPSAVGSEGPHNRLSRFTYDFTSKTAALNTEKYLLKVVTQRNTCCHAGGDMEFDNEGNLILVTGDNTNPFESSGFNPIDERVGHEDYDAQRSSGNTNDLRGKVLRITPQDDGTYTVPAGNLFAANTALTRPEIYGMGFRNPFRIGIDPKTNNIIVADYGPDSNAASATRGPDGRVEWNLLTEAGNYGWPYCHSNTCYNDFNFETNASGAVFNPNALVNNSPNNTGLTNLPPAKSATVWYGYGTNPLFPEIGGGGAPMGGPVYRFDEDLDSDVKWPEYWDGKALFGEWNQGKMYSFQLDTPTGDTVVDINRILPGIFDNNAGWARPMDFQFGPDGALYVIDWGSGFGGNNDDSGIYKVNYTKGDPSPIARGSADVTDGAGPLTVKFDSTGTRHPLSKPITLQWTFGDGSDPVSTPNPTHTYQLNGEYTAQLLVTDSDGKTATANVTIVVGNQRPVVTINFPDDGGFFEFGDQVRYEVSVVDPDGDFDCDAVTLTPALGHDSHAHPMEELEGCEGFLQTSRDDGHGAEANLFWVVEARYTDDGGAANVPLQGFALQVLQPKRLQSEFFTSTGRVGGTGGPDDGVRIETTSDTAGGGSNIGFVETNDWWAHEPASLLNIETLTLRAANPNETGIVSARWGSPTGTELGQFTITNTGGWQAYQDFSLTLPDVVPTGTGGLFFVLLNGGVNVNWLEVSGAGVTSNVRPTLALDASPLAGPAPLVVDAEATATDPDGDTASLVYRWNKGEGAGLEVGTAAQSFTYTTPGTYRLTVRATDALGAYQEKYVTVIVTDPLTGMCLQGRSDGFDGTVLDEERWPTVIRRNQDIAVDNGHLVIPASKTDIYGTDPGTVSNIVLQPLQSGAWQATTKVTIPARAQYQQAGLIVYGDDNNYVKMVIQGRSAAPDAAQRVIQFAIEKGGTATETNSSNLGTAFPDTVYLRLTSNGTTITGSYSDNGIDYTSLPASPDFTAIANPKIGLTSFANSGSLPGIINAEFDWFTITPDETAVAGPDDEFDGTSLNGCRWQVLRESAGDYRVSDGSLRIDTSPLDIYGADTGARNFVLQDQPEGDWVVETKVDGSLLDRQYQQGGIILHADDDNYVKLDILSTNTAGSAITRNLELRSEINGVVQEPQQNADEPENAIVYLRLGKTGNVVTGWHSANGTDWTQFAQTLTNPGLNNAKIGLFALGAPVQTAVGTVGFEYFRVVPPAAPLTVTATVDPAAPTASGWYDGDVSVTLATEGGLDTVYREFALDGGIWQEYTTPVIVSESGSHSLAYRATSGGDATDEATVTFKIDTDAPVSSATVDEVARSVTLRAADAGSGLARIEYSQGDTAWLPYTAPVVVGDALSTVKFRAVDKAGNVEATNAATVPAVGIVLTPSATAALAASGKVVYGAAHSVTVRVSGPGATPTGSVDVVLGNVSVGTAVLVNGRATVAVNRTALLPGVSTLSVRYSGDAVFEASTDTVEVTVVKATSKVTAKVVKKIVYSGTRHVFTVKVTSSAPVTGTITIKKGTKVVASGFSVVNGVAKVSLAKGLPIGTHKLTVHYSGSDGVAGSKTGSITVTVKRR
ncbi:DUF1349 domain-containing protein [Glaciihabitans arcticus]|uniref:DUF1349 domain-containing protein n=1 Tax=Glaciihabitans arcticus TaxID=2668039 RepID=A0A4Q9GM84_9MICO|nr:ThuA domain-containing protein [Glaciihabitans arcticus]TBN55448.1 DUF1349 domain-containing protein [Glaciihabitans arcticus]